MAAQYDFRENPNPNGEEGPQPLHPRIVVKGRVTTEQLIREITEASTLTTGDMVAVLRLLSDRLSQHISNGYVVELGDIGTFTAKLKSRPVMDKSEIRAASISFNGASFRPTKKFTKSIQGTLKRATYGFSHSSGLNQEESKKRLDDYMDTHSYITRKEYSRITGKLQKPALKDLNQWVKEGYLAKHGSKSTTAYTRIKPLHEEKQDLTTSMD